MKEWRTFPEDETRRPSSGTTPPAGKGTPMLKVLDGGKAGKAKKESREAATNEGRGASAAATSAASLPMDLDELAREGARRMIAAALARGG